MGERREWAALTISAPRLGLDDLVSALLDDFAPAAIEDLRPLPLPPGGLWDPTYPPIPEPPPAPLNWRAFFQTASARDEAAAAIRRQFPDVAIAAETVPDEDWAARSQRAQRAIRAGSFIVAPPWDRPAEVPPGVTLIVIEPSRGFGTGHHASTQLCLRALSDLDVTGGRVLDLGTGSGVLAMAAALKGAREILAVDVDPDAIEAARESALLNTLPTSIDFAVRDFRESEDGVYDVVLANLTGGMLMSAAACIAPLIAPGGVVVMSGFDESERVLVRDAFPSLMDRAFFSEEGWVGLVLQQPYPTGR